METTVGLGVTLGLGFRTPTVCKIMAFRAVIRGLGLLFYLLLGFRIAQTRQLLRLCLIGYILGLYWDNGK